MIYIKKIERTQQFLFYIICKLVGDENCARVFLFEKLNNCMQQSKTSLRNVRSNVTCLWWLSRGAPNLEFWVCFPPAFKSLDVTRSC